MNARLAVGLLALGLPALACSPDAPSRASSQTATDKRPATAPRLTDVQVCQNDPAPTPAELIAAERPREARIYLDGSVSMKGFSGQGDRFRATLDALRPVLLDLDIRRSRFARVGEEVETLSHSGGFERFDAPSFYSRGETNLAAALDREIEQEDSAALTLLVSDGVTSLQQGQGSEGDLAGCGQGSDVQCLTVKLEQLIGQGQSLWIVGLRSAFRGPLFSETARVGGARLGEDVRIPDRPFYLWILSSHPPTGRALVAGLLERLSVQADRRAAFALEIAPGHVPWSVYTAEQAPISESALFPEGARAGAVRGKLTAGASGEPPSQVVANRDLEGTAFALRIPLETTPLSEMPPGIAPLWTYAPSHCLRWERTPPRGLKIKAASTGTDLRVLLLSPAFDILAGRRATLVQTLARTRGDSLSWIESWSTRDDRKIEAGSRTLNFEELVRSLQERLDPQERFEQPILRLELE